jgi:predicted RNA-binding protein with PUA-like domain
MNNKKKAYWLLKSEPDTFSIEHLKEKGKKGEPWTGVRNYQARNNMLLMSVGDICYFYHSSCEVPGIVGLCEVVKNNVVDETQFDTKSEYYDPKSSREKPRWKCIEVRFVKKFKNIYSLKEIRENKKLENMVLLQKGSRLSVQPVDEKYAEEILKKVM